MKNISLMLILMLLVSCKNVSVEKVSTEVTKKVTETKSELTTKISDLQKKIGKSLLKSESLLVTVTFTVNDASLSEEAKNSLDSVVKFYKSKKNTTIMIQGYTDTTGNDTINIPLSLKRSESVKRYLIDNGCANIKNIGYGSDQDAKKVTVTITSEG